MSLSWWSCLFGRSSTSCRRPVRPQGRTTRLKLVPGVEALEDRIVPAVNITPEPAAAVPGPAGHQVEFRVANFNINNNLVYTDFLFGLPLTDNRVLADGINNGVPTINYNDNGSPTGTLGEAMNLVNTATPGFTVTKGSFASPGTDNNLAGEFSGYINIPQAGTWNFTVASDDGFELRMGANDAVVALFDSGRGLSPTTGQVIVSTPGWYHYQIEYDQGGGGAGVEFYANGPGQAANKLVGDPTGTLQVVQYMTGATEPSFVLGSYINTPAGDALGMTTGDFNGDGNLDVATANYDNNTISLFLNNGAGGLAGGSILNTPGNDYRIATGDFNGDGKIDVVSANYGSSNVSVFQNMGGGTFANFGGSPFGDGGTNPIAVAVGDFNSDGKLDLAFANYASNNVSLMLGNGNGTFQAPNVYNVGTNPYSVAVGDFNGDGKPDLVVGNFSSNNVSVLLGNGDGTFQAAINAPTGTQPLGVVVGDFNHDGKFDVATANYGSNNVSVLLGNGNGTLQGAVSYDTSLNWLGVANTANPNAYNYGIATGDLNNDGFLDLVVAEGGTNNADILLNNGDGTFHRAAFLPVAGTLTNFANDSGASGVAVGDFNNDGAPDIAVSGRGQGNPTGSATIYLNEGGTRTVLGASPNPVIFGQTITLTATVSATVLNPNRPGPGPTGTVNFFDNGVMIGSGTLVNGVATFSTSSLAVGAHNLTAVYAGAGQFFPSTSKAVAETVNPASSSTTLVSSINPGTAHQPVTFTATVTGNGPVPATGSVTFFVNGVAQATVPLSNGTASFSVTNSTATTYQVTATYGGDTHYLTSMSAALTEVINYPPPTGLVAVGTDAGVPAVVNVFDATTHALKFSIAPFGSFTGGVRVAVGDVNGDCTPDIICAAGPGGGPLVCIYDGRNGNLMRLFYAFSVINGGSSGTAAIAGGTLEPLGFTGGLNVAAGDVNGDGVADIIIGADAGGSPQIEVVNGKTLAILGNFIAFNAPGFRGGVRVAAGDVNGDGLADIIVGAGPGTSPQVTVYDGATLGNGTPAVLSNFYAFGTAFFTGGTYVAAGDTNGDGLAEIIVGAGAGGGPQVQIYGSAGTNLLANFYAMPAGFRGGVRVGAIDLSGIGVGRENIVAGAGPGGGPQVAFIDGLTLKVLVDYYAFVSIYRGGLYVSG